MDDKVHQNVLIVNDEPEVTRLALETLAARGVRGIVVCDVKSAVEKLESQDWDLILVDLDVPEGDGLDLLRIVKANSPELPVVMIGPDGSVARAVRAMREGCEDVLVRPVGKEALENLLAALLPNHDVPLAASCQEDARCLYQIAGRSPKFLETLELARKVAPSSVPVLITGESGTGKELVSYFLHRQSRRARGPYVRVNCAALTESLLESELFGHERGAFTGAYTQHKGRFERAHGGTLLLDEISETGRRLQAELLRVLEEQDFERVGGSEPVRVNVRVISTSNRDLAGEVRQGRFRADLYYRLGGVHLPVSALRDRPEDIPALVWYFVNLYCREVRRRITALDSEMLEVFRRCRWPGNVRQLRNAVRGALIFGEGPTLSLDGAPAVREGLQAADPPAATGASSLRLRELERQAIFEALRQTKRNQAKAARLLGITDRTLREKLRRYRQNGQLQPTGEGTW